jgi:hypothetical protein
MSKLQRVRITYSSSRPLFFYIIQRPSEQLLGLIPLKLVHQPPATSHSTTADPGFSITKIKDIAGLALPVLSLSPEIS